MGDPGSSAGTPINSPPNDASVRNLTQPSGARRSGRRPSLNWQPGLLVQRRAGMRSRRAVSSSGCSTNSERARTVGITFAPPSPIDSATDHHFFSVTRRSISSDHPNTTTSGQGGRFG